MADSHGVFVSFVNLVGSEGGKMFAGGSCVSGPRGDLRITGPLFEEGLLTVTIDLADLTRARADLPMLADLRTALPHLRRTLEAVERGDRGQALFDPAEPREPRTRPRGAPPETESTSAEPVDRHHAMARRTIPTHRADQALHGAPPPLEIDAPLVERWLVRFIRDEMERRRLSRVVVGVSGGVDSAVTAFLAARALGAENVLAARLPYRTSSAESLEHAQLVVDALGVPSRTVDISGAVDGYLAQAPDADPARRGNVMARVRMIVLFDLSAEIRGVPLGTGNKTERLFGYFTWHADDSPPINPLGDLFKSQVWALARHLGVPDVIVNKPATADLIKGQTDEGDFGISYSKADEILNWLVSGFRPDELVARSFAPEEVELVRRRLEGTHWKRRLPTVAMVSQSAIGESYLRPVDY
jgi:NAD+ synthetase